MESRQPFFKPLENQFVFQEKQNMSRSGAAAQSQQVNVQGQGNRDMEMVTEKMSTLHSRLYQEAEKIRKWKTQTEIDIQIKNKKIKEATSTIENLRKSILELQIQNENLSGKLQDELENREEVLQKINATRDMCNLLKAYSAKVEGRLQKCETERTELKYLEKEHQNQFEMITKKFAELEVQAGDSNQTLVKRLETEQNENLSIKEVSQKRIDEAQAKMDELLAECREKDHRIANVTADLGQNKEMLESLEQIKVSLESKLQASECLSEEKERRLKEKHDELDMVNVHKSKTEASLQELQTQLYASISERKELEKNFDETEKLHLQNIKDLQKELGELQQRLSVAHGRLAEFDLALAEAKEEVQALICTKETLLKEQHDGENKIMMLEKEKMQIEKELQDYKKRTDVLIGEKLKGEQNLESLKRLNEETTHEMEKIEKRSTVLEEEKNKMDKKLQETQKKLDSQLVTIDTLEQSVTDALKREQCLFDDKDEMKKVINDLTNTLDNSAAELELVTEARNSLEMELKKIKQEKNELDVLLEENSKKVSAEKSKADESKSTVGELRKELKEAKLQLKDLQQKAQNQVKDEASKIKRIQTDLDRKTREWEALEKKASTMKTDNSTKTKQIKELEKERNALKKEATHSGQKTIELSDAQKELETELTKLRESNEKLTSDLKTTKTSLKNIEGEQKNKDGAHKKLLEENNALKKLHDGEMAKMVNLLEEYKIKNEKTVAAKDDEIRTIQKKVLEESLNKNQSVQSLEEEMKTNKEELTKKEAELLTLKDDMDKQTARLGEGGRLLKEKEDEVVLLKTEKSKMDAELEILRKKSSQLDNVQEVEMEKLRQEVARLKCAAPLTTISLDPIHNNVPMESDNQISVKRIRTVVNGDDRGKGFSNGTDEWASRINGDRKSPLARDNTRTPKQKTFSHLGCTTPLSEPSRSILKPDSGVSINKRRKVVFNEYGPMVKPASELSESEVSDASTSALMEVELDSVDRVLLTPKGKVSTPLVLKQSRQMKQITPRSNSKIYGDTSSSKAKENIAAKIDHNKNKRVTPNTPEVSNLRKTPVKSANRLLKPSPLNRNRMALGRKHPKKAEDLAWFDSDAVFGFGPED